MGPNVILFGWNRSIPGREKVSLQHFDEFVAYLTAQQKAGAIDGFDIVLLDPHGGDLNGMFLIKAESKKLMAFAASDEWTKHLTRATLHLQTPGAITGATGSKVMQRMKLWSGMLPA